MSVIRTCRNCGRRNRIPVQHLAHTGRCGACKSSIPPVDEPLEVDPEMFNDIIQNASVPVLVDFWAAWCGPCKVAAPEVARTAKELLGQAIVLKVDTERHSQLAARYGVHGIPTFAVFYGSRLVMQQAGLVSHEQMANWLRSAAKPISTP